MSGRSSSWSPNHVSGAWASSSAQPTMGPEVRPGDARCKVLGVRARQGHVLAPTAGTSHGASLPALCSPASPRRMPGTLSWGWLGIFETVFGDKCLLAKKKAGTQFCKCGKLGHGAGEDGEKLLLHQEGSPGRRALVPGGSDSLASRMTSVRCWKHLGK